MLAHCVVVLFGNYKVCCSTSFESTYTCYSNFQLFLLDFVLFIQSYLIAIAAGDLESRKIGPRSHVWSEKEYVDKAAYDFAETEIMLQKAEELCGPYVWGIYDILVLPPSFPFGGMENPCVTFATPTLLGIFF